MISACAEYRPDIHILITQQKVRALADIERAAGIVDADHLRGRLSRADKRVLKADIREFCEVFHRGEKVERGTDDGTVRARRLAVCKRKGDSVHRVFAVRQPRCGNRIGDEDEFIALSAFCFIGDADDRGGDVDAVADELRISVGEERGACGAGRPMGKRRHRVEGMGKGIGSV